LRGCLLGRTDPPLSERGRVAALSLATLSVRSVFTSPLRRARETAEAIRAPLEILPELAEIDFGEWDGLTWREIERRSPELARRKVEDWFGVVIPGGEAWPDFRVRVERALDRALAAPAPVAIVAHVTVNAVLAARLMDADPRSFRQEYGEILTCEYSLI